MQHPLVRRVATFAVAIAVLVFAMGGTWSTATSASAAPLAASLPPPTEPPVAFKKKVLVGKLNLNTATEEQLQRLPTVGPAKAERIVVWRKKNGGFKRIADLRRVKGFGYKTFKKLEAHLDITGETTLGNP